MSDGLAEGFYWIRVWETEPAEVAKFEGGEWWVAGCELSADTPSVCVLSARLEPPALADG